MRSCVMEFVLGEKTFPGGYFVRRSPFTWGHAPNPGVTRFPQNLPLTNQLVAPRRRPARGNCRPAPLVPHYTRPPLPPAGCYRQTVVSPTPTLRDASCPCSRREVAASRRLQENPKIVLGRFSPCGTFSIFLTPPALRPLSFRHQLFLPKKVGLFDGTIGACLAQPYEFVECHGYPTEKPAHRRLRGNGRFR